MAAEEKEVPVGLVMVLKAECLKCRHLSPDFGIREYPCTTDKMCPAQSLRIVPGCNIQEAAKGLAEATENKDTARIARIMQKLSGYDQRIQTKVLELARTINS